MAFTVFDVVWRAYSKLGQLTTSKATGPGSTTTLVDSTQARGADDTWKEGALFVIYDAGAAGAAPQGSMRRISAFTASTGTFTVDTAFTTATAAGDVYGFAGEYYPLQQMLQLLNQALEDVGDLDLVDTTTLDTATGDTEYAAAVTWKKARPTEIAVQGSTADAQDNQWLVVHDWDWVEAAPGSTGLIIFGHYPYASRDIRVRYRGPHPYVIAETDVISETLDRDFVVKALTRMALEWQNTRLAGSDPFLLQRGQAADQAFENAKVEKPVKRRKSPPRLLIVGGPPDEDQFTFPGPA